METIRVLQIGTEDFSRSMQVSDCAEWYYEPDFSELPEQDFDVVILGREVAADELEYLIRCSKAYCLFVTEDVLLKKGGAAQQLFVRKMEKSYVRSIDPPFTGRLTGLFFKFLWREIYTVGYGGGAGVSGNGFVERV